MISIYIPPDRFECVPLVRGSGAVLSIRLAHLHVMYHLFIFLNSKPRSPFYYATTYAGVFCLTQHPIRSYDAIDLVLQKHHRACACRNNSLVPTQTQTFDYDTAKHCTITTAENTILVCRFVCRHAHKLRVGADAFSLLEIT